MANADQPCMSSSWIQIDAHGRMSVDDRAATSVLAPLGDVDPLNLISIFGAARQGKSFLMNCLAGREGTFKISNDRDPCTQGIDISRTTVPLREFASMDGGAAVAPVAGASALRVGFVDAEGQGDRDVNYDARLASPVLLMSRCVIFNWKDSLQKDRIIQSLGVMVKAAANVVEGSGGGAAGASSKKFGHLHIVFRDWVFASSDGPAGVYKQLFERERSADHDAMVRNEVRRVLVEEAFESVHVWLFPPPTERVDDLGKQLRPSDLSARFRDGIKGLRAELAAQLRAPMAQFGGRALTGGTLARLAPVLVKTLNSRDVIMPVRQPCPASRFARPVPLPSLPAPATTRAVR